MSPKAPKKTLSDLKAAAQKGLSTIDVDVIKDKAAEATSIMVEKVGELKDAAVDVKDDIAAKLTELDRMLQDSVTEYNDAYTIMNDKGVQLYIERCRSLDSISFVESLVNSIANRPKSFDAEFEEISVHRKKFTESRDFADRELQEARKAAAGAGAGLAAGASVAFMAPTAAMWVATTFGTRLYRCGDLNALRCGCDQRCAGLAGWRRTVRGRRRNDCRKRVAGSGRPGRLVDRRGNAVVLHSALCIQENQVKQAEK